MSVEAARSLYEIIKEHLPRYTPVTLGQKFDPTSGAGKFLIAVTDAYEENYSAHIDAVWRTRYMIVMNSLEEANNRVLAQAIELQKSRDQVRALRHEVRRLHRANGLLNKKIDDVLDFVFEAI